MIEELTTGTTPTCDADDCDRTLPSDPALVYTVESHERRAYECACGAVTVTVVRSQSTR